MTVPKWLKVSLDIGARMALEGALELANKDVSDGRTIISMVNLPSVVAKF